MDEEIIFMKNNRYFRILLPKILEKFGHFKMFGILGTKGLPGQHAGQVNLLKRAQINFTEAIQYPLVKSSQSLSLHVSHSPSLVFHLAIKFA